MTTHILQRFPSSGRRGAPASGWWKRFRRWLWGGVAGADPVGMRIGAGQELRLQDAAGWTVACLSGSVWLTQEADTRDLFLDAGESFTLDRVGLALILARQDSALAIRPASASQSAEAAAARIRAPAADTAREVWLRAVYPECGPWNDPAGYRRSGLL